MRHKCRWAAARVADSRNPTSIATPESKRNKLFKLAVKENVIFRRRVCSCGKSFTTKEDLFDEMEDLTQTTSDLDKPMWAIISSEDCIADNLTFSEAEEVMRNTDPARGHILCIVTNDAAEKLRK